MKKIERISALIMILMLPFGLTACGTVGDGVTKYAVSFTNAEGVPSQSIPSGKTAEEPPVPTKTGYSFEEWQLNGGKYHFTEPVISNISLVASWTANKYQITLHSNGAVFTGDSVIEVTYDSKFNISVLPQNNGVIFAGWYDSLSGGAMYVNGNGVGEKNYDKASNSTLYAQFFDNFKLTLDTNGGNALTTNTYDVTFGKPYNLEVPVRAGYNFAGWFSDTEGNGIRYTNVNGSSRKTWNVAGNITLYAKWYNPSEYTAITDVAGLKNINNDLSANYILLNDLDLSSESNWTPIGSYDDPSVSARYNGVFDGNSSIINKLTILGSYLSNYTYTYFGLFGDVYYQAILKNIGIENINISITAQEPTIGGLVGRSQGIISNCYTMGKIESRSNNNSSYIRVGGLAGMICSADKSFSTCEIIVNGSGSAIHAGGLAGSLFNKTNMITQSYATGNVTAITETENIYIGGFLGFASMASGTKISSCYASGNVNGTLSKAIDYSGSSIINIGGFIGSISNSTNENNNAGIENCYSNGNIAAESEKEIYAGGFVGYLNGNYLIMNFCYALGKLELAVLESTMTQHSFISAGSFAGSLLSGTANMLSNAFSVGNISIIGIPESLNLGKFEGYSSIGMENAYYLNTLMISGAATSNQFGVATVVENLKSKTWLVSTLGFSESNWLLIDDSYPILK